MAIRSRAYAIAFCNFCSSTFLSGNIVIYSADANSSLQNYRCTRLPIVVTLIRQCVFRTLHGYLTAQMYWRHYPHFNNTFHCLAVRRCFTLFDSRLDTFSWGQTRFECCFPWQQSAIIQFKPQSYVKLSIYANKFAYCNLQALFLQILYTIMMHDFFRILKYHTYKRT
jgi:hypothetical protein